MVRQAIEVARTQSARQFDTLAAESFTRLPGSQKGWPRLQIETTASNKMKHGAQRWTAFIVSGDFALIHIGAE